MLAGGLYYVHPVNVRPSLPKGGFANRIDDNIFRENAPTSAAWLQNR